MKSGKWLLAVPLFVLILAFSTRHTGNPSPAGEINWMTWKEVQEAQKKEKRKVFVDVYTDWCGWCKRMDANTFSNPEVITYLNKNFYSIKFNAESKETIKFKDKDYKFIPEGRGYNELAAEILNGQLSYPTAVYLDETLSVIFPVPGYQDAKLFESVINYVGSNSYKTSQWEQFQASFKGKVQ